jgi:phenylalanyl-tRNA synthetase alpha chain
LEEVAKTGTHSSGEKLLAELRKRKLIVQRYVHFSKTRHTLLLIVCLYHRKHIHYSIAKGPEFALEVKKLETDLTTDMLNSGAWKNMSYKKYNFNAAGAPPEGGALHPLLKVREEFRSIFFDMG